MTESRIHRTGPTEAGTVLVVNARYGSLDMERELLAPYDVIGVSAASTLELVGQVRQHRPDALIVGSKPQLDATAITAMDRCRVIVRYGVGVDNIDLPAAEQRGIVVANVRDYCTDEVATHALLLVLACARALPRALHQARGLQWGIQGLGEVRRLEDLTVGIVGFGAIGRALADKLVALGLAVVATDPWVGRDEFVRRCVERTSLSELLAVSDIVSINSPLTDETTGLIGSDAFGQMKPGAYLVNTARAEIVQEQALVDALDSGRLAGAALDVLRREPPAADDPLLTHPAVLVTPHMAWYSITAIEHLRRSAAEQVRVVLSGQQPRFAVAATD